MRLCINLCFLPLPLPQGAHHQHNKHQKCSPGGDIRRRQHQIHAVHRAIGHVNARLTVGILLELGRDPFASHKKPVCVDSVRRARHKRAVILPVLDLQILDLTRKNDADLIDLIRDDTPEHNQLERVALLHPVDIREELGRRKTRVARDHAVHRVRRDGQRASREMPGRNLQHALARVVVDRQIDVLLLDLDISHDAGAADVERTLVLRHLVIGHMVPVGKCKQLFIEPAGLIPHGLPLFLGEVPRRPLVGGDRLTLMKIIPPVAEMRIEQHADTRCKEQDHEECLSKSS